MLQQITTVLKPNCSFMWQYHSSTVAEWNYFKHRQTTKWLFSSFVFFSFLNLKSGLPRPSSQCVCTSPNLSKSNVWYQAVPSSLFVFLGNSPKTSRKIFTAALLSSSSSCTRLWAPRTADTKQQWKEQCVSRHYKKMISDEQSVKHALYQSMATSWFRE